jgi:hypothetical protein
MDRLQTASLHKTCKNPWLHIRDIASARVDLFDALSVNVEARDTKTGLREDNSLWETNVA